MTPAGLFSVRMRAVAGTHHLSGAERLVLFTRIGPVVERFLDRAWSKGVSPDQVVLTIEPAGRTMSETRALDLTASPVKGVRSCRDAARRVLEEAGVTARAVRQAFSLLDRGPSTDGGAMRGAMIMDRETGERLEADHARGVRASRFDWSDDAFLLICGELARLGLTHFRTREALALASKIAGTPGFVAELCWSDDRDYTAGYVSTRQAGYVRLASLKDAGAASGGRAVFIDRERTDRSAVAAYLERQPVLITAIGRCSSGERDAAVGEEREGPYVRTRT